LVIAFHSTGTIPNRRAVRSTKGRRAPKGGRKKHTGAPAICSNASLVRASSCSTRPAAVNARFGWLKLWFPHQLGLSFGKAAHQKERRPHFVLRQQIQQARRPRRIGPIVKRQRQLTRLARRSQRPSKQL
jgi:hypothetical protein